MERLGHLLTACRRRNVLGGSHRRTRYLRGRQMDRQTRGQKEMVKKQGTETGRGRENGQEQKADPRVGAGVWMGQWEIGQGAMAPPILSQGERVTRVGWMDREHGLLGKGLAGTQGPSLDLPRLVPGPKAHQASPRSDISHTWESPRRRSSLGVGKGRKRRR